MAILVKDNKPIYCRQCGARDGFDRCPDKDIKSESGKVMWEAWCCRICHNVVIEAVF